MENVIYNIYNYRLNSLNHKKIFILLYIVIFMALKSMETGLFVRSVGSPRGQIRDYRGNVDGSNLGIR